MYPAEVFISYAWGRDETVAGKRRQQVFEELNRFLKRNGFTTLVDFERIKYKSSIKEFMQKLGNGKYIVMIVSDRYLKSPSCMFEVVNMFAHEGFKERIFPIVLPDAKIYTSRGRTNYLKYWDEEIRKQEEIVNSLQNKANALKEFEELNYTKDIRRVMSVFTQVVGDMNTMNLEHHKSSNYKEIANAIEKKVQQDVGLESIEDAYSVLELPQNASLSLLKSQHEKLLNVNQKAFAKAKLPEVKNAHQAVECKLNVALDMLQPILKKQLSQQKIKIKRLIRAEKHIEAKNLLIELIKQERHEEELQNLLKDTEKSLTLGANGQATKARKKAQETRNKTTGSRAKNTEVKKQTQKRSGSKTSNSRRKVVQPKKMQNTMQVQAKNRKENKSKVALKKIIIPSAFAILAIIAGFTVKEHILKIHVDDVIQQARQHVVAGELSTAVRLLEDSSRDLIYEEKLAEELEGFRVLKKKYDELLLQIRSYKKQKKWKLAERAMLRILEYTPQDSFMIYQLEDVQKELKVNDFNFWMLIAEEAIKQGEPGYLKAKEAILKAKETKVGKKIIKINLQKVDSLIDMAFNRHQAKLKILYQSPNNRQQAIKEAERALLLHPDNAEVKTILAGLKKQQ